MALVFLLSVFHFYPSPASAQALAQLGDSSSGFQVPGVPVSQPVVYRGAPGFNVYFVNVGQGDAIYLELPGGKNALIDGGPSSAASGPLAQFLASKGVSHLDHVVLTHPHSDHFGGLKYVFSNIRVDNFYDTRMNNTGATTDEAIREQARTLGVNLVYPSPGDSLDWADGVGVKVFNSCPEPVQSKNGDAINNCSIVLRVSYQDASALFTGDMEAYVESSLIARFGTELRSKVLKVGHHGSQYSSSTPFLQVVHPDRAYIEVGKNNYGHPTAAALDRLAAVGASVFRTDLGGTMSYFPEDLLPAASD